MGGLSLWHWLVVLVIVVLVFGTRRLKNVGQDLGEAVKGFRKGMQDEDKPAEPMQSLPPASLPQDAATTPTASRPDDDERKPPVAR